MNRQRMAARRRRCAGVAVCILLVAGAAFSPVRENMMRAAKDGAAALWSIARHDVQTQTLILPELEVYALQLGVYESGERAQTEAERLLEAGIPCVVWQRERMRLVCGASLSAEGLDHTAAAGRETFVVHETLPQIRLRLNAEAEELKAVCELLRLPDTLLETLDGGDAQLDALVAQTRSKAQAALTAHPESVLYTQLAQSLMDWCALVQQAQDSSMGESSRVYAQAMACVLADRLRSALGEL